MEAENKRLRNELAKRDRAEQERLQEKLARTKRSKKELKEALRTMTNELTAARAETARKTDELTAAKTELAITKERLAEKNVEIERVRGEANTELAQVRGDLGRTQERVISLAAGRDSIMAPTNLNKRHRFALLSKTEGPRRSLKWCLDSRTTSTTQSLS